MKRQTVLLALASGAFAGGSCMVYDAEDLRGLAYGGDGGRVQAGSAGHSTGGAGSGSGGITTGGTGGAPTAGNATGGTPSDAGRGGGDPGGESGAGGEAGAPTTPGGAGGTSGGVGGGAVGGGGTGGGPVPLDPALIEDCENENRQVITHQGRDGWWFVFLNGTATVTPKAGSTNFEMMSYEDYGAPVPDTGKPNFYGFRLHSSEVMGADGTGVGAGFNFRNGGTPYADGARNVGLRFWARANRAITVHVDIPTVATDTTQKPMTCMDACSNHYSIAQPIGDSWGQYEVLFEDFEQASWGGMVPLDLTTLVSVQFYIRAEETDPEVELWLDDISFIPQPAPVP